MKLSSLDLQAVKWSISLDEEEVRVCNEREEH